MPSLRLLALAASLLAAAAAAEDHVDDWPWGKPVVEEVSGRVIVEGRLFVNPPRFPGQQRHSTSLALAPEFYMEWDDYTSLTLAPYARLDSADRARTHFDMREAWLQVVEDDWELGLGLGKLFWGVTESVHLVDIVNQTEAMRITRLHAATT